MFCKNCGASNLDDAIFCFNCGNMVSNEADLNRSVKESTPDPVAPQQSSPITQQEPRSPITEAQSPTQVFEQPTVTINPVIPMIPSSPVTTRDPEPISQPVYPAQFPNQQPQQNSYPQNKMPTNQPIPTLEVDRQDYQSSPNQQFPSREMGRQEYYPLQNNPYYNPIAGTYQEPHFGQNSSGFSIWGPFAGYGTRRSHQGWLMDNKGDRALDLISNVRQKFQSRRWPDAYVQEKVLVAKGIFVEKRPYFLMHRKLITVGLYISEFGRDLYLSIASYIKPPISNLRVIIVLVMALFSIFTTFLLPSIVSQEVGSLFGGGIFGGGGGSGASVKGILTLICLLGPLGMFSNLALGLLALFSGYKWLTEKDLMTAFRTKPNEFNEDDLMSMEKACEQTVRMAIDEIGLDPDELRKVSSQENRLLI